jgi:hypothetical protein
MAFAIEVPGEAAPLTPQQVYLALQSAGSSQQLHIQTGTQQLQSWETQRGYYTLLQVSHNVQTSRGNEVSDIQCPGHRARARKSEENVSA